MSYSKQCLSTYNSEIKGPLSFTVGNGYYLRINVTQCNTDSCNSALPQVTPDTTPNGLQCPTCFALNSDTCNGVITPCTGQETYCLELTGSLLESKFCHLVSGRELPSNLTPLEFPRDLVGPGVCAKP
nr:phospholipase A2 inhibitor and Ly6/PLAUR domain-containing protein-like [Pelodiscus sinensis]XP_025035494.1 phospholipase A2 inhibitor and Ly6/PLAUR domain-containing protein-like [Pelodiscus sinensis]|eukprot:XP_025035491.1 phospholipase A2 inhibitor and Ly6/PLAUR domain-containing protein-like [Pelodiscus sinensis]